MAAELSDPAWWATAIFAGLIVQLAATWLYRRGATLQRRRRHRQRSRSANERREFESAVASVRVDTHVLAAVRQHELRSWLLGVAVLLLAVFVAVGAMVVPLGQSPVISGIRLGMQLLAMLLLFLSLRVLTAALKLHEVQVSAARERLLGAPIPDCNVTHTAQAPVIGDLDEA